MKKRIRKKGGFTLAEALIATAILALFVSMAIVGTSGLFGTGEEMMAVSKAAVLGSDVMKVITNELRFGESFKFETKDATSDKTISYDSTTYGENCTMFVEDGQLKISSKSVFDETSVTPYAPISTAAYDEVHIKDIIFEVKNILSSSGKVKRQNITCTISITSDGTSELWKKAVTIVPISQKTDP